MDLSRWLKNQWDRSAAVLCVLVGLVALIAGWVGVSGSSLVTEQIPYLASGAVFGLFALGVGATLWLSADLRDEWRKLDDIHNDLRAGTGGRDPADSTSAHPSLPPSLEAIVDQETEAEARARNGRRRRGARKLSP